MDLLAAIRDRRTIKVFTGAPVPRQTIEGLVQAAEMAPNHRLTQPWRFAALDADGVARLVAFVQTPAVAGAVEARKLPMVCERLARCGAVVQVCCLRSPDPERQREDLAAVAAAVQNLLLAAHGAGLGSFWSTSPLMAHPEVLRWFGSDPVAEDHVATIWLGVPAETPPAPRRAASALRWV